MKEALEIKAGEKCEDAVCARCLRAPKQNWREKRAAADDRCEIGE